MDEYIAFSTIHVPPRFVVRDLRPAAKYAAPLVTRPLAPDALTIDLVSDGAFGTGAHPTTQLCLTALSEVVTAESVVLDLGCGSGVLGIGAAKLGARKIVAVDIDQAAAIRTRDNAALNQVAAQIDVRPGSTAEARPDAPFDVLVANLLTPIIFKLAPEMPRLMAADGTVILSGVLAIQADRVQTALHAAGLRVTDTRVASGWCAFIAKIADA